MRYFIFFLLFSVSAIAEEVSQIQIEDVLDGLQYQSIGQSRYQLVMKEINGKEVHPKCRKIFNKIYRLYRGPHIVQKFWEEAIYTHRRVWKIKNKNLSLRCFEKNGIRYAERISFYDT